MAVDEQQGTGWPLAIPWDQGDAPAGQPAASERATRPAGWPPGEWPTQPQLTYTKELIIVFLLILSLPWLVSKLLTSPGAVLSGLGQRQVSKAVG